MKLTVRPAAPCRIFRKLVALGALTGALTIGALAKAQVPMTSAPSSVIPLTPAAGSSYAGLGNLNNRGKDLSKRWGLGIANIGPKQQPTLSVDWNLTQASGFQFDLGMDTTKDDSLLSLAVRFNRSLFIEDHQLYFLYFGGGLLSQQVDGENDSGYLLEAGPAARFFLPGLPNLGFMLGGGFRLESLGGVRIRTVVNGGMHYYF